MHLLQPSDANCRQSSSFEKSIGLTSCCFRLVLLVEQIVAGTLRPVGANISKLWSLCILIAEWHLQWVVHSQVIDAFLQFLDELEVLVVFGKPKISMAVEKVRVNPGGVFS